MATRSVLTDEQTSFAGGLNTISAPDALGENQIRRADNGRLTIVGAFQKRGGTQKTAGALAGTHPIQNGAPWYKADGSTVTMAVVQGTLFTATFGAFPLTWTQRGSAGDLSSSNTPSFAPFVSGGINETMYIADGGPLNKYAGTTLTTNIAGTPNVTFVCVHNGRLWGVGDSSNSDSLYYSAINDGDSLGNSGAGGGVIIDRVAGMSNLTALASVGSSLMMGHDYGISRLTGFGQDDTTVTPAGISGDVGVFAPFSFVRLDTSAYLVTERGLHQADESQVVPVTSPTTPDPLSVILPTMQRSDIQNIRAIHNRGTRELWIMVPGIGLYVFHTILRAWSGPWLDGYLSPEVSCLFETNNADNYPIVLAGDASGFVRQCDVPGLLLDNVAADGTGGTSYVSTLQPHRKYAGAPDTAKAWRYAYVLADLHNSIASSVNWQTDTSANSFALPITPGGLWGGGAWGAVFWGGTRSEQTSYRVDLDGTGYWIDLSITDSGQAASVVSAVRVQGYALGRR